LFKHSINLIENLIREDIPKMVMGFNGQVLLTIGLAPVVIYLLRFGGLTLTGKLPSSGKSRRFMDSFP
jgi:hypothetical protein